MTNAVKSNGANMLTTGVFSSLLFYCINSFPNYLLCVSKIYARFMTSGSDMYDLKKARQFEVLVWMKIVSFLS